MTQAFICDAIRTPVGRYNGGLSAMRVDDLAAHPIKALMQRNANVDWGSVDDVIYGCVNQAGEDNRNVARMAGLLAGLPVEVAGATVNRLCGSGLEAAGHAARAVKLGEADAALCGLHGRFDSHFEYVRQVIGAAPGVRTMATMNALMPRLPAAGLCPSAGGVCSLCNPFGNPSCL